jgi:hypothetical protein
MAAIASRLEHLLMSEELLASLGGGAPRGPKNRPPARRRAPAATNVPIPLQACARTPQHCLSPAGPMSAAPLHAAARHRGARHA